MQNLFELEDLGQVYFQPIKHPNGSVFFVTVKNLQTMTLQHTQSLKKYEIEKLVAKANSTNGSCDNSEIEDGFLFKHVKVCKQVPL
jgi:hypothetical protein